MSVVLNGIIGPEGGSGGSGDVVGPASSTDNAIARYDGTTGKLLKNSGWTINDTAILTSSSGAALFPVGSAAAPSVRFVGAGSNNCGIYQRAAADNILDVAVNGGLVAEFHSTQGVSTAILSLGSVTSPGTKVTTSNEGDLYIAAYNNGYSTRIRVSTTTVNLSGATSTATGLFPAKCIQLGVTYRVTTLATSGDGGTSINVGDGSDPDRYGATIAFAAGTTGDLDDATADPRGWSASAGDVVFTCNGGTFSGGVVRVCAHYIDLTAPTS